MRAGQPGITSSESNDTDNLLRAAKIIWTGMPTGSSWMGGDTGKKDLIQQ